MAGTRRKRSLDPPTYRTHAGLSRSPYAEYVEQTAEENASRQGKTDT